MEIKEKNLTIVCENSNLINHNQVLKICEVTKIPFKNHAHMSKENSQIFVF